MRRVSSRRTATRADEVGTGRWVLGICKRGDAKLRRLVGGSRSSAGGGGSPVPREKLAAEARDGQPQWAGSPGRGPGTACGGLVTGGPDGLAQEVCGGAALRLARGWPGDAGGSCARHDARTGQKRHSDGWMVVVADYRCAAIVRAMESPTPHCPRARGLSSPPCGYIYCFCLISKCVSN